MAMITIGREYGSGGHEIGEIIAQKLGIPFYDKEILNRAAEESGLCRELFDHHDEKAGLGALLGGSARMQGIADASHYDMLLPIGQQVFLAQFDAITKLAQEGSCVIVGRCANYVLKDEPHAVHVFFYASEEQRIRRIMRLRRLTREQARDEIRKNDKQRRNYYNFFAEGNWGQRQNYTLMLCTDGLTAEAAADLVIAYVKARG